MTTSTVLAAAAVGIILGFVLQRGRFCLNTAFRDILTIGNFTVFRSYLLAVVVALVGANVLEQFGVVRLDQGRQEFTWAANIIGGYLFGIGMVLAGGCASGTWYRVGEGLVGSWMAALGLMLGAAAANSGALAGVSAALRRFVIAPGAHLTLNGLVGVNRWLVIVPLAALGLAFVFLGASAYRSRSAGPEYHHRTAGVLVGLISVLAWYVSYRTGGEAVGISFAGPSEGLLLSVVGSRPWGWGVALLAGVPIGAFLSARGVHQFSWRSPRADAMVQQLLGGALMGIGGMFAGGCLFGHGITGISALAVPSVAVLASVFLGCWTMVYFLFLRNASGS